MHGASCSSLHTRTISQLIQASQLFISLLLGPCVSSYTLPRQAQLAECSTARLLLGVCVLHAVPHIYVLYSGMWVCVAYVVCVHICVPCVVCMNSVSMCLCPLYARVCM